MKKGGGKKRKNEDSNPEESSVAYVFVFDGEIDIYRIKEFDKLTQEQRKLIIDGHKGRREQEFVQVMFWVDESDGIFMEKDDPEGLALNQKCWDARLTKDQFERVYCGAKGEGNKIPYKASGAKYFFFIKMF